MIKKNWMRASLLAGLLGVGLTGCDGLLEVTDPQRYTTDDLDASLDAVVNGVEGDLYVAIDGMVNYTALNSDEYQHTGTWIGYDDYDKGRFMFRNASGGGGGDGSDGVMNELLRARGFAQSTQERLTRVLGSEAASSPLMARVKVVEGWADLLLGQQFCEAPSSANGPAISDEAILKQAVAGLTEGMQLAQAADNGKLAQFAQAGRARANLLLGNYDAALADAQAIPAGFEWNAEFSANSGRQYNSLVQLTTVGQNRAAAVRQKWWPLYDASSRSLKDPYSGTPDARLAVFYDGKTAVDALTPHYSQWKYRELGSDIQLTDAQEMRLVEAEVLMRRGDLAGALDRINQVRTAAGQPAHAATNDAAKVREFLLHERLAEMFLEGQRMSDLHRFALVKELTARGDFGPRSVADRPTKFPLSYSEALYNPEISEAASERCLPRAN